jgi:PKD repeat protein
VAFDARNSTDNVGIVSYKWDFGDGTEGTGLAMNHVYVEMGNYTAVLTVRDAAGNKHSDSVIITVVVDTDGDGVPDLLDTDDDGDGMLDSWETAHGLDPLDRADASLDPDGDRLSNLEEYRQGTDPKSYFSPFPFWVAAVAVVAVIAIVAAVFALFLYEGRRAG